MSEQIKKESLLRAPTTEASTVADQRDDYRDGSRHTPGPWTWREGYEGLDGVTEEVMSYADYENCWLTHGPSRDANAHLIAAAPELLEACQAALAWAALDGDGISEPTRSLLMAAIAKATTP